MYLSNNYLSHCFLLLVFELIIVSVSNVSALERRTINLGMPDVRPTHDESYLCSAHRLNLTEHEFIVGFQPNASALKVHHILIYGCVVPGKFMRDTPSYVWECGEMNLMGADPNAPSHYDNGPVCQPGSQQVILFGWALDAPAIDLPQEVGFKIGGDSGINYLVLQVHYGNTAPFKNDLAMTDDSGILLHTVYGPDNGITKLAGIYLLMSYGYVPIGHSKHTMNCILDEDKVIHPFRFRTHTHKLGVKVGGYKKPANDPLNPILIGEHDPQKPQMFYPVETEMTIGKGDQVYAYCDYNNTRGKTIHIGATGNDEMCNFYVMYWTEGHELLKDPDCVEYNPHNK